MLPAMPAPPSSPVPPVVPSLDEALAKPLALEAVVEPRFIDSIGHMNVASYVHLFDRATWAFFARVGIDDEYRRRANVGMFAVEEHVRYLAELREGEALAVHTWLQDAGGKWLRLGHAMVDRKRQRLSAVAEVVGVHIDFGTRRSKPFPDELAARLRAERAPAPAAAPGAPLTHDQAWRLARDWVEAWNAHDLDRILEHYDDDVVLTSPVVVERLGDPSGTVRGKAALRGYFQAGLAAFPALRFDLVDVMWGLASVVLYYVNQRGTMTGEFMELAPSGKVARVVANYSGGPRPG
jgi:acyl-CoA thioesterase FadM/ketosteroid isomerase-like protein